MKHIAITSALALSSAALFAGEMPAYVAPAPVAQPSLYQWFAGGSVGYLFDAEEEFYSAHLGFDMAQQAFGCTQSLFLEVGYAENKERQDFDLGGSAGIERIKGRLEFIPITLNYKLERQFSQNLNSYFGIGAGVAIVDAEVTGPVFGKASDEDTTFFGQVFAGLLYDVSDSFELYTGVRWIYMDNSEIGGISIGSGDDWLAELGARFNF